jgi:hypothetical protein
MLSIVSGFKAKHETAKEQTSCGSSSCGYGARHSKRRGLSSPSSSQQGIMVEIHLQKK